mmetsp:Transcript_20500/g.61109  ORF Transcript_20500/g.61109 Transcript_20500/m.61109 type:complete len:251 (-) Transcript_20500:49-801(-)
MKPYAATLERLKTVGSAEHVRFTKAVAELKDADDYQATLSAATAALRKLVDDPDLFSARRAVVAGSRAPSLMAALGYAATDAVPDKYEFAGARTPVALRRLALAANALDAFAAEEPARRAKKALEALPPEPVVGAAGTTTITFLPGPKRRRYDADDTFDRVMQWLRVAAAHPNASLADVDLVHPRRELAAGDGARTLQALDLWPSATVRVRNPNAPPPPPPTNKLSVRANKPKPSDLFRAVNNRFAKAGA